MAPELSALRRTRGTTGLTDDHMQILEWRAEHPTRSLAAAAKGRDPAIFDVDTFYADLVYAGMIERAQVQ